MPQIVILTDGKAGHENQSRALARALDGNQVAPLVKVRFRSRFCKALSYLFDHLGVRTGLLLDLEREDFKYGTIFVGTGSGTFYAAKAMAHRYLGKAAAVLYPRGYHLPSFDVVLAPEFDHPVPAPNVIPIPANLVSVDGAFYASTLAEFERRHGAIREGLKVGVIVGGPNKCSTMTKGWAFQKLTQIFSVHKGAQFWVTTSRRTPPEVESVVDSFPWDYKLVYSRDTFNPIPAFVQLCDVLYVSAESTGMISEACSIGKAEVRVMDNLNPGPHKFRDFVEGLAKSGYVGGNRKIDLSPQIAAAARLLGL